MDAELAQLRIRLQLADLIHRSEIGLHGRPLWSTRLIIESAHPFLDPAAKGRVDDLSAGLEISRDAGDVPAFSVQPNDSQPAFCGVENVAVLTIAPPGPPWCRTCSQDVLSVTAPECDPSEKVSSG